MMSAHPAQGPKRRARSPMRIHRKAWIDGLRGITSMLVVSSHMASCFASHLEDPSLALNGPSTPFQRPFLRLIIQGQSAVAIFFVLLGFVNSSNVIQASHRGLTQDALLQLTSCPLRRAVRLVIPSAMITVISWFLCQFGCFLHASRWSDDNWFHYTSPRPSQTWISASASLFEELRSTWLYGENQYANEQWTMKHLLQGTGLVYTTLLGTISTTPSFRLLVEVCLYLWSWSAGYVLIRTNVLAGMVLAELSILTTSRRPSRVREVLSYPLGILGLYLCSYPRQNAHYALWSRNLQCLGMIIFPSTAKDYRCWHALGAQLLCLAVVLSHSIQAVLSSRYLAWLGRVSFAVYLLHGLLMRTVLVWTLLLFQPFLSGSHTVHHSTPASGIFTPTHFLCPVLVLFWIALLAIGQLWLVKVEPCVHQMTALLERFATSWGRL